MTYLTVSVDNTVFQNVPCISSLHGDKIPYMNFYSSSRKNVHVIHVLVMLFCCFALYHFHIHHVSYFILLKCACYLACEHLSSPPFEAKKLLRFFLKYHPISVLVSFAVGLVACPPYFRLPSNNYFSFLCCHTGQTMWKNCPHTTCVLELPPF
jgi:hypothetical protein